jgi:hypothetical protein
MDAKRSGDDADNIISSLVGPSAGSIVSHIDADGQSLVVLSHFEKNQRSSSSSSNQAKKASVLRTTNLEHQPPCNKPCTAVKQPSCRVDHTIVVSFICTFCVVSASSMCVHCE